MLNCCIEIVMFIGCVNELMCLGILTGNVPEKSRAPTFGFANDNHVHNADKVYKQVAT